MNEIEAFANGTFEDMKKGYKEEGGRLCLSSLWRGYRKRHHIL